MDQVFFPLGAVDARSQKAGLGPRPGAYGTSLSPADPSRTPKPSGSAHVEPRLDALAEQLLDVLGGQKVAKIFETLYVPPDLGPSIHALSHGTGPDAQGRSWA